MFKCPECDGLGKRRPRTFVERIFTRAKLQCSGCNAVWYWRRILVQKYTHCPDCGTPQLAKRSKYDRIDRKSKSIVRRYLQEFSGAPVSTTVPFAVCSSAITTARIQNVVSQKRGLRFNTGAPLFGRQCGRLLTFGNQRMTIQVTIADRGKRLDSVVHAQLPQFSRSRLQSWIREGRVLVDGVAAKSSHIVRAPTR